MPASSGSSIKWSRTSREERLGLRAGGGQDPRGGARRQDQHDARLAERAPWPSRPCRRSPPCTTGLGPGELFPGMTDAFFPFRDRRGMQAFDVQSGREDAQEILRASLGPSACARCLPSAHDAREDRDDAAGVSGVGASNRFRQRDCRVSPTIHQKESPPMAIVDELAMLIQAVSQ